MSEGTQRKIQDAPYTIIKNVRNSDIILSEPAIDFLVKLHNTFSLRIGHLLQDRESRKNNYKDGKLPDFDSELMHIKNSDWHAAPLPKILQDRRVEITGPVDRKMIINALNSGAKVFMADFEDASSPSFANMIDGQINLKDFSFNTLDYIDPTTNKSYALGKETAILMVRPRGLYMQEKHFLVGETAIPASLFDFGLHFFHNAQQLIKKYGGIFYYLPKLESYHEAKLWNDIFVFAQEYFNLPIGSIRATVLIETLDATFVMDEIIFFLKDHIAGLNCGRWDYIFSYIKTLKNYSEFVLPDRQQLGMDKDFLLAYSEMLIETCHKRKIHAMGGMAAQIPVKNDENANNLATQKVESDKLREVTAGHDGTWVAHPNLIPVALKIFNQYMPNANQIDKPLSGKHFTKEMLLKPHLGTITEKGIRTNISVCIEYLASWLQGRGAVPIHNLMEDAATAEISRSQLWQWLKYKINYFDESFIMIAFTKQVFLKFVEEEMKNFPNNSFYTNARSILEQIVTSENFEEFITTQAYDVLCQQNN